MKRLLPLLLGVTPVLAAEPDTEKLLSCLDVESAVARLDCFDRESRSLIQARRATTVSAAPASTAPSPAVAPAPAVPAATVSPLVTISPAPAAPARAAEPASFGEDQLKPKDRTRESTEPSVMQARIATLRNGNGGVYFITLDNGQVWRHESGSMAEYLNQGAAVTISKAALGSYRLTLDDGRSKNWIRVSRVR